MFNQRTVCLIKFDLAYFLKDAWKVVKWILMGLGLILVVVIVIVGVIEFVNAGIQAAGSLAQFGQGVLWVIALLYAGLTAFYKAYAGEDSFPIVLCWVFGLFGAFIAGLMSIGSPAPVPQLLILALWGAVLFTMRYAWLVHRKGVAYCNQLEKATSPAAMNAAKIDQRMM